MKKLEALQKLAPTIRARNQIQQEYETAAGLYKNATDNYTKLLGYQNTSQVHDIPVSDTQQQPFERNKETGRWGPIEGSVPRPIFNPKSPVEQHINMYERTEQSERAKDVQEVINSARKVRKFAGAANTAAELLAGYSGGPFAEIQGQIGSFFPESEYGKIASARELARALRAKMAPDLRAIGSGSTSDLEFSEFMSAFPDLSKTPRGRQLIRDVFNNIAKRELTYADLYQKKAKEGPVSPLEMDNEIEKMFGDRLLTNEQMAIVKGGVPQQYTPEQIEAEKRRRGIQ
jgi:hypothetical protein